jgi:PAS domain S-box-containing protein
MGPIDSLDRDGLILLHAPIGRDARLLHDLFHRAGLVSQVCLTVEHLCREVERGAGAVFVTEEALDASAIRSLSSVLQKQAVWSDLPLVVLTIGGEPTDAGRERLRRLEPLGGLTLLERPLRSDTILSAARTALRARARQCQVRRRDAELQIVTDSVPVLISCIDRSQVYRRVNQTYYEWFGIRPEEVVGRTVRAVVGEPHTTRAQPYVARALAGERVSFESQLWDKHGSLRDVVAYYAPDFSSDGSVRGLVELVHDITDRKKTERALTESEQQFRSLADTIPNLAWMAYPDGNVFWYNQRWYEYTGATAEALMGWGWQSVHDPEVLPTVVERWRESIATGTSFEMVFPLRGADGVFRPFLTRVVPVRDSAGAVARWFGTNTDIDKQKRTEDALRQANRDLEEFAYVASHDLQEPLRMVNVYSQLLLKRLGPQTNAELEQYCGYVRAGVKRMQLLIQDLLDYSRVTQSEDGAAARRAELDAALQKAMVSVDARVQENHAEVSFDALPAVMGDECQLAHVFQNLLSNALKYRKRDEPPRIHIGAERRDGHWVVSVKDNGIGFDQEQAKRIFGLFKRLHRDDEYPGSGLGLAICKHIVERYKGRIWAESQTGVGSTFFISLPAAPNE